MPEPIPLTADPAEERLDDHLEDHLALCLSGGGYRAMLFHLGSLWYLHDAGYLPKLDFVSSVSGGSITAGVLALRWGQVGRFQESIVTPIRKMASTTIDAGSVIGGMLLPGTVSDRIVGNYKKLLFQEQTLQDFPDRPRFIINATNVGTGSLFRFSKAYIADWRIGIAYKPKKLVAEAVAASSAFPPILSPARIEFAHEEWSDLNTDECGKRPFTTKVVLSDGGVYDNMGIETTWKRCKRVLISDAGGKYQPDDDPKHDWARHSLRINGTIDNQVRSLRKRQVVSAFRDPADPHKGAYWGMWTKPSEYPAHSLTIDDARALEVAKTPTRLAAIKEDLQNRIINFGYGMTERALRSYFDPNALAPSAFPCPGGV